MLIALTHLLADRDQFLRVARHLVEHHVPIPAVPPEDVDRARIIFNKFDKNGSGSIDIVELSAVLNGASSTLP